MVRALSNYDEEADELNFKEGDLSFKQGDIIEILDARYPCLLTL